MSPSASAGMEIEELKRRMKANGIENAHQLAAKLGVTSSTAWRWLKDKTTITIGMAALIRQLLPKAK